MSEQTEIIAIDDSIDIFTGLHIRVLVPEDFTAESLRARCPNAEIHEVIIEWGNARREMTFAEFKRAIFGDADAC